MTNVGRVRIFLTRPRCVEKTENMECNRERAAAELTHADRLVGTPTSCSVIEREPTEATPWILWTALPALGVLASCCLLRNRMPGTRMPSGERVRSVNESDATVRPDATRRLQCHSYPAQMLLGDCIVTNRWQH
eukprot:s3057_g8.t1